VGPPVQDFIHSQGFIFYRVNELILPLYFGSYENTLRNSLQNVLGRTRKVQPSSRCESGCRNHKIQIVIAMKLLTIAKTWMIVVSLAGFITTSSATSVLLDLSKDFEESPSINQSPGAVAILNAANALPNIRTLMVLEDGEIVASYARDNVDSNEPYQIHSVTKSITSLLMGILIDDGAISLNETLGQIFTNETTWQDIEDADYRKVWDSAM
jgi:Beta-lactamase